MCITKSLGEENLCDHFDQYYKRTNEVEIQTCHNKKLETQVINNKINFEKF